MQIVLPGALPDSDTARSLAPHVQRAAPTLQRWRARGRAQTTLAATTRAACTAYEQWQLTQRGFVPDTNQNISAGLGALLADSGLASDEPVWLAELVHIVLASDGAALVPARRLDINAEDSRALLASARTVCAGTGFRLEPHSASHWRVIPDEALQLHCASPELVAASSVHDWWPQQAQARAWRQVFNALQMHWFDHPVNHARAARGAAPINGLWLFGGARPAQLRNAPAPDMHVHGSLTYDNLIDPWTQHDWGAWLAALADLERAVFAPLARAPKSLVLIGGEEIVEVRPAPHWWHLRFWRSA